MTPTRPLLPARNREVALCDATDDRGDLRDAVPAGHVRVLAEQLEASLGRGGQQQRFGQVSFTPPFLEPSNAAVLPFQGRPSFRGRAGERVAEAM
jgi:hypothetical protein